MSLLTCFKSGVAVTAMAVACLGTASAQVAPVLVVDASGLLVGATGVTVGTLGTFDVSFVDGSCAGVFSGCDTPGDFTFTSFNDAHAAARALLDTVLLDSGSSLFDSNPGLTRGCEALGDLCFIAIPVGFRPEGTVEGSAAANRNSVIDFDNDNGVTSFNLPRFSDSSSGFMATTTWSVWTPAATAPIPEPGTLALLGVGGAFVWGWSRRRSRMGVTAQ